MPVADAVAQPHQRATALGCCGLDLSELCRIQGDELLRDLSLIRREDLNTVAGEFLPVSLNGERSRSPRLLLRSPFSDTPRN